MQLTDVAASISTEVSQSLPELRVASQAPAVVIEKEKAEDWVADLHRAKELEVQLKTSLKDGNALPQRSAIMLSRLLDRLYSELPPMQQQPARYGLDRKQVGRMRKQLEEVRAWESYIMNSDSQLPPSAACFIPLTTASPKYDPDSMVGAAHTPYRCVLAPKVKQKSIDDGGSMDSSDNLGETGA
jgi:hypothetical protein